MKTKYAHGSVCEDVTSVLKRIKRIGQAQSVMGQRNAGKYAIHKLNSIQNGLQTMEKHRIEV
jgi:hypothetical protein